VTDFIFEERAWELKLRALKTGSRVDAAELLALLGDEEEAQEALETLEARQIGLDVSGLVPEPGTGELALRLKREKDLADRGLLPEALEESDPLGVYLREVAGLPAAGDPQVLATEYAAGNESAGERLVNGMLSQVIHQAMALAGRGVLLLDLIQEGSLGLWQSIMNYTGGDFMAQSCWWIAQYQAKAVFLQAMAGGAGEKLRQALEDYRNADRQLLTRLGRNPLPEEIAASLGISGERGAFLEKLLREARQQQKAAPAERQVPEEEDQSPENTAYYQSRQRVREMLSGLSEEEAELVSLRYGLEGGVPMDPELVGRRLGLTPEEVVAREAAALEKLRKQTE